ncbi:hypothetical protein [Pseudomonas leptonychotis]|uniref:Uncharacterized protein n=1 Tax=Pseudomonas leptonychotis TaxID=2448482 RepID=A0A4T1ZQK8_9PSED|nr:hypothetical protein [Pseudomonas leptonychotis]TIH06227.1 hypothetical protein D8779_20350 [Pseudomonas leptonychotis]
MPITELFTNASTWTNENQGVLTVALFIVTVFFGWFSGIFSALRRKPKFKIETIPGPTFSCTYLTGNKHNEYDAHQTAIAIYLYISNVGAAPSSIHKIRIAYHWNLTPWSFIWLKNTIGWFWIEHQAVAITDFQAKIGGSIKVYPFLTQRNYLSPAKSETFLEVGQSTNGVVYFEQPESWGGCFPKSDKQQVKVKIEITDVFGRRHKATIRIPAVSLEEARKYNPEFGNTLFNIQSIESTSNEV